MGFCGISLLYTQTQVFRPYSIPIFNYGNCGAGGVAMRREGREAVSPQSGCGAGGYHNDYIVMNYLRRQLSEQPLP